VAPRDRIVYSTGAGRICPGCRRLLAQCTCGKSARSRPAAPAAISVGRQTQGRAGKAVTVVTGLALTPEELAALARELKQHCGSGGTVRAGAIEIQGEHRDRLLAELQRRGLAARRSSG
jgi:translation initiation factor 1